MPNTKITREAIAGAVKRLMETTPFDRITTADIIGECGISRKTFYYHFRDKYDVVNWIFTEEVGKGILECTTPENWAAGSFKLCHYIRAHRTFYRNAVNASGQNCFVDFLRNLTERQLAKLCAGALAEGTLTEDDFRFLVEYYYNAFIGVFTPWVRSGMKESPDLLVRRWIGVVDGSLGHYIDAMGRLGRPKETERP